MRWDLLVKKEEIRRNICEVGGVGWGWRGRECKWLSVGVSFFWNNMFNVFGKRKKLRGLRKWGKFKVGMGF